MKATLLVLLLSAVAVMLTCDHQHSEREAGPGCPLGKRLAFDLNTTLEESKRLNNEYFDCPNPEPGAPCFYYSHVFYPFFVIEDTVVGESDRFHDSYTFKVVGGGRTRESVRNYSQEEILKFNSLRDSESYQQTLVWTFDDVPDSFPLTKEGFIVMRGASNRVSIVQNPVLDHVILLVVLLDTSTLMAHTFQSVTVTTSWCLSAVNSCLLVFYVLEALFKILIQGRTYFRNPWNDLDFFIVLMTLLDFVLSLVQSGGGFSNLDVSLAEIEEEFYKEALRHASSDGKHSKRKIELTKRYLQLLAAMDQHAQKYRSQACLLDNLVETFFMDQDEETRSDAVE
ncbi:hypothetical protein SRHO_G00341610 [Serrasalmus rhombeus]